MDWIFEKISELCEIMDVCDVAHKPFPTKGVIVAKQLLDIAGNYFSWAEINRWFREREQEEKFTFYITTETLPSGLNCDKVHIVFAKPSTAILALKEIIFPEHEEHAVVISNEDLWKEYNARISDLDNRCRRIKIK